MNLDRLFISSIIKEEAAGKALLDSIQESWLFDPYNKAFAWVRNHFLKYGKTPSIGLFEEKFDSMYQDPGENYLYFSSKVRNRFQFNSFMRLVNELTALNANATDIHSQEKLLPSMAELVQKSAIDYVLASDSVKIRDLFENASLRYQDYLDLKDPDKMKKRYVASPWLPLNQQINGFEAGDFICIVGKSGLGKTWSALQCGKEATLQGKKVLVLTEEMTIKQMEYRLDALFSELPIKFIRQGTLDALSENAYRMFLENLEESRINNPNYPGFIICQGSGQSGVNGALAIMQVVRPDIVIIDGAYLFSSDYGWEKMGKMTGKLKQAFMQLGIPGVVTNQVGAKMSSTKAAFSPSFYNDATVFIELYKDEEKKALPFMNYKLLKAREGDSPDLRWTCNHDFIAMDFKHRPDIIPDDVFQSTFQNSVVGGLAS